jgi:hypothetical protein
LIQTREITREAAAAIDVLEVAPRGGEVAARQRRALGSIKALGATRPQVPVDAKHQEKRERRRAEHDPSKILVQPAITAEQPRADTERERDGKQ